MLATTYRPPGSVTVSRGAPEDREMAVTVAPGTTPPCGSVTTPVILAVSVWAKAVPVLTIINPARNTIFNTRCMDPPSRAPVDCLGSTKTRDHRTIRRWFNAPATHKAD